MNNIAIISDFEYKGQRLLLKTSQLEKYIYYFRHQTHGDLSWFRRRPFLNGELSQQNQHIVSLIVWERFQWFSNTWLSDINTDNIKKIIDVGSGLATTDILLSQYLPAVDFYLVDKNTFELPKISNYFSNSLDEENYHGFYNSFDLVKDTLEYSGVNEEKINFLSPDDQWPEDVDIIFSTYSWMWHYHKDIYWSRLLKSLKIGGYLMISTTLRDGETTVEDISMDLGSYPLSSDKLQLHHSSIDRSRVNFDKIIYTGFYVWQRLR